MAAQQSSSNIEVGNLYTPRRPAPLIGISVNHPIATAARKIKNFLVHKQTLFQTSFSIKVTPIVAIVSLFGVATLFGGGVTTAYHFGKTVEEKFLTTPTPKPTKTPKQVASTKQNNSSNIILPLSNIISKAGTLQATYQYVAISSLPINPISSISSSQVIPTPRTVLNYILTSRNGSITYLKSSSNVSLADFLNQKVLVTGSYDSSKNILTVSKSEDIEVL